MGVIMGGIIVGQIAFLILFLIFMLNFGILPRDIKGLWVELGSFGLSRNIKIFLVIGIFIALFLGWILYKVLTGK
ncbi:hypothetical protein HQN89_36770 [Paenibacillus frigoriresistens]|uniref:hypothetical protein n=1 Tax=Paenibacillus alginolyticus TaxID=59839 RepID=UPI00156761B9|nr:hypothetical protein [Paenibacillus frigoriresistens]NRF96307.1 hypothetical protein [Paenibacillus frigoriresistens]